MTMKKLVLLMAAPLMLVACGGGNNDASSTSNKRPSRDETSEELDVVERTHDAGRTGIKAGLERRQVNFPQEPFVDIDRI